jgi:hypothetical protein
VKPPGFHENHFSPKGEWQGVPGLKEKTGKREAAFESASLLPVKY